MVKEVKPEDSEVVGGYVEVKVIHEPSESVVTITTPEPVVGFPWESVVVHEVVNEVIPVELGVSAGEIIDVVVVNRPSESVVTITTPESVVGFPLESVVVHEVVKVVIPSSVVTPGGIVDVVVVNEPSESVVTITTPESVVGNPFESVLVHVVVKVVRSVGSEVTSGDKVDVVVVNEPTESVVTITTPEPVVGFPSESVVVHEAVNVVSPVGLEVTSGGIVEVNVVNSPSESVVTTTTPESVIEFPSELVVVHVVVNEVRSVGPEVTAGGKIDVVVVNRPSESVVTITTPESVVS